MLPRLVTAQLIATSILLIGGMAVSAQQSMDMQQMEKALNQLDKTPPVPQTNPAPSAAAPGQFPFPQNQQYSYAPQAASGYTFPGQAMIGAPGAVPVPAAEAAPPMSPLQALFSGKPKPTPPPKPVNPLQYVMQQFLGGGSNSGGSPANDQQKIYNAREYLQTANNQASRAYNACQRASYGSDKYARKSAADEAYYAAQSARYAANNATSAAAGGPSAANDAAAQARDAADRAQADADRARANADGGGW